MCSEHIAYSYLSNVLSDLDKAQIKAYLPYPLRTFRQRFLFKVKCWLGIGESGVYKSFGAKQFIEPRATTSQRRRAKQIFSSIYANVLTRQDIENIEISGIRIGDLIYDTYLREYNKPTIEPGCQEFRDCLLGSVELFIFWEDYMVNNKVSSIIVSHCVYNLAIPLRIGVAQGIKAFQATLADMYRLSKTELFASNDFFYFRDIFSSLSQDQQESGLAEARDRIKRRFEGEVGVDMPYSTESAFGEARHNNLISISPRLKILVAAHCFYDSPHCYGMNLFSDFVEWLEFLDEISRTTDYDWYIKMHPEEHDKEIILQFVSKNPRFKLLPSDSSHIQIVDEGIDFALTVYGTVGFEYAAMGVPVINASQNNPHIAYNFNIHPKSREEYKQVLESLDSITLSINIDEVHEYYFMRNIYSDSNLFLDDYWGVVDSTGGYYEQFKEQMYATWLERLSISRHKLIYSALTKFVLSGDYRLSSKHIYNDRKPSKLLAS